MNTEAYLNLNLSTPSPPQDCDPFLDSTPVKVIKTIAYSVLLILSLGGNSLVIAVIYRNRNLRTVINFLILNMSISDILMPIFAHTMRMKQIYLPRGLWQLDGLFGSITCKFTVFAAQLSITVSVLNLEIIAIERFFCVVFPMKTQPIRSKRRCFIVIAIVWLIGVVYESKHFYSSKHILKNGTPYCIYSWEPAFDHAEAIRLDFSMYQVSFALIPFLLLTSLYSSIIISLHRQKANLHLAPEATQRRAKENRRVTFLLLVVIVVFLATWLPVNIYMFLSAFVWSSHRPCESRHLIFSAVFLSYSYPAINPFIYYVFNENYKKGFRELLCCKSKNMVHPIEGNNDNYGMEPVSSQLAVNSTRSFETQ